MLSAASSSKLDPMPSPTAWFCESSQCFVRTCVPCAAQRRASAAMVVKLAQAKFPDALGMEMKEIKVASARAAACEPQTCLAPSAVHDLEVCLTCQSAARAWDGAAQ